MDMCNNTGIYTKITYIRGKYINIESTQCIYCFRNIDNNPCVDAEVARIVTSPRHQKRRVENIEYYVTVILNLG